MRDCDKLYYIITGPNGLLMADAIGLHISLDELIELRWMLLRNLSATVKDDTKWRESGDIDRSPCQT